MTFKLVKKALEDEGESFWVVRCLLVDEVVEVLPYTYIFSSSSTEQEMQNVIVTDLSSKGYSELTPLIWENES